MGQVSLLDSASNTSEFDVRKSVHRNISLQYNQQDAPFSKIIYSCKRLYMFRVGLSFHHQELKTARTATDICQTAAAAGSSSCLTYACCCMCSLELLMMDGKTVPKHVQRFTRINNLRNWCIILVEL